MSHFLDWKYISLEQATSLEGALSDGALRSILSEALRLSTLYDEARCRVALDLYADCYLYCKSQAFCAHRTSTLLSIAADAFIRDTSNRSPAYSMTSSFEQLRDAVLRHSVERPPRSIRVFDESEVAGIFGFFLNSYYRRYELYQYIFNKRIVSTLQQTEGHGVETITSNILQLGGGYNTYSNITSTSAYSSSKIPPLAHAIQIE